MNETNNPENTPTPLQPQKRSGGTRTINPLFSVDTDSPASASVNVGTNYHSDKEDEESQVGGFIDKPLKEKPTYYEKKPNPKEDNFLENTKFSALKIAVIVLAICIVSIGLLGVVASFMGADIIYRYLGGFQLLMGLGLLFRVELARKIVSFFFILEVILQILAFIFIIFVPDSSITSRWHISKMAMMIAVFLYITFNIIIIKIITHKKVRKVFN